MPTAHTEQAELHRPSLQEVIDDEQRSHRKRVATGIAAALMVLVVGVVVTVVLWPQPLSLQDTYRTKAVDHGAIHRTVSATGRVEPRTSVDVGAQVSGRIESIEADYNDHVQRGDVLARFDAESLRAQAVQAKANVSAARATLHRAKVDLQDVRRRLTRSRRLYEDGLEPREQVEALETAQALAQATVEQAAAQVTLQEASARLATTNLSYTEITAPIDGVVISRNVERGQTVVTALQSPVLFVIAEDLNKMRVVASIDEADIGEVKPGQSAVFTVDAYPDRRFEASVAELRSAARIEQNVVTYEAILDVDNPELLLRPGMTASIEVETASVADAVRIPNAALRFVPPEHADDSDPHRVWLLREDSLTHVHVVPGVSDGTLTEVVGPNPFLPGDAVVVDLTPAGRKALEGEDE